jgi:hypothetical protein
MFASSKLHELLLEGDFICKIATKFADGIFSAKPKPTEDLINLLFNSHTINRVVYAANISYSFTHNNGSL